MLKFIRLGEEPYPQIPPNGKWLSPKFEKSEIGNFRKQNEFSPKIKLRPLKNIPFFRFISITHKKSTSFDYSGGFL